MAQQFITGNELSKTIELSGNNTFGVSSSNTITINGTTINCPNNLNFDSNTLFIDSTNNRVGVGTSNVSVSLTSNGSIRVINQELQTVEQSPNTYTTLNAGILVRNETPIIDSTGNTYSGIYTNQKVYANSASAYTSVYGSYNNPRAIGIATTSRFLLYGTYNRLDRGGNEPLDVANNPNTSLFGIQNVIRQLYSANASTDISTSTVYGTLNQITPQIGTMVNVYGTYNNILLGTTTSSSANATNYYANYSSVTVGSSNTSLSTSTLSNYYGLYLAAPTVQSTGTITNRYGVYQADSSALNYFNGNVGIGTSSITSTCMVDISGANQTPLYAGQLFVRSNDAVAADVGGQISFGGNYSGTTVTQWASVAGRKDNATSGQFGGYLAFSTRPSGGNTTERLRIDSAGNVGIGTSSPSGKIETIITATASATSISRVSDYTDAAYFTRNTNVGKQALVFRGSDSISSVIETGRESETVNWNTYFAFYTQGGANTDGIVERVRINGSGTLILNQGQIKFPATQVASADANTLDDYEEGTFTITLSGSSSGSGNVTGDAYYTKIGRMVTISLNINNQTLPAYSGFLKFSLPFPCYGTSYTEYRGGDAYFYPSSAWDAVSNFVGIVPTCSTGNSFGTFNLIQLDSNRQTQLGSDNSNTSGAANAYVRFSLTYFTNT